MISWTDEELLRQVNATKYGLAAYVYSGRLEDARERVARRGPASTLLSTTWCRRGEREATSRLACQVPVPGVRGPGRRLRFGEIGVFGIEWKPDKGSGAEELLADDGAAGVLPAWVRTCIAVVLPVPAGARALWTSRPLVASRDITHRRHAIIETTFADLIDGPLAQLPAGFAANHAWAVCAAMTHNCSRRRNPRQAQARRGWRGTLRRHILNVPARIVRPNDAGCSTRPAPWPWADQWTALWRGVSTVSTGPAIA